jgi:3-oxoacyl-[acyl-carrier protein] reductase
VEHNVTINNLLPGPFNTDRLRSASEMMAKKRGIPTAEAIAMRAADNPSKRLGEPEEFGDACAYICSAQAGYFTGQNFLIDAGEFPGTM